MEYKDFLKTKVKTHLKSGFKVLESELNKNLFEVQKFVVSRACEAGKYAIFADCGLGKTIMQLSFAEICAGRTNKPSLILTPLAVKGQTLESAKLFEINMTNIEIWNYEQIENLDCSKYGCIVLDESSILKNYSGAYKQLIIQNFEKTEYKLACTATPSPNDELEIGNHAEFLNVMTSQDMRAMFFTTDKEIIKGEKYRLKRYAEKDFYHWISTWAVMYSKPSDLGYSDEGYDLPGLEYIENKITTSQRDNGLLFNSVSVSATNFNQELRLTKIERLSEVVKIVNNSKENFIIWIKQNEEGEYLKTLIPDAVEVSGSDTLEYKENKLLGFGKNEFRVLITKTKIASFGMNYQNCRNQIFASLDFSFESLYQAIRRSHRFGQINTVNIYLITIDTMQNVIDSIREKEEKHIKMQDEMRLAIIKNTRTQIKESEQRIVETEKYKLILGDCVEETSKLESNSIDYSFFSPPFGALYVFSNNPKDMSNVRNNDEFMQHFKFLVIELLRVMKEGRLVSIHMMQSTTLLGRDGFYSIVDFRGDIIRLFQECGFYFHAENMIRKDPKTAAIRTKNRQLMHGTTKKDSSIVRPGLADYILTFKKPGENLVPIQNNIPFDLWCKIAEPVWLEMNEGDTIDFRGAKGSNDERHITPTQLTPIRWCYNMWCNIGETVLSPFSGVASEGYVAIETGRKYIGIELKESYFDLSIKNLNSAIETNNQTTLF